MKHSNLAWRIAPPEEPVEPPPAQTAAVELRVEMPGRARPRPRFGRRTIVIRDQGFAPFRVR